MFRNLLRSSYLIASLSARQTSKLSFKQLASKLFLGGCLVLYVSNNMSKYNSIQDKQILKVKGELNKSISQLKSKYGDMTVYPAPSYNLRGNTYSIQFQIDQRKCNIFAIITLFFSHYNSTQDSSYRICDLKSMVQGEVITFYVDFQEKDPKWRTPQKGRLTITGIRTNQRPNFRVILEKDDFITDKNILALKQCYHQSVKPKQESQYPQPTSSFNKNQRLSSRFQQQPKKQNELYKKLEEFGVTVFDPKNKQIQLDWDFLAGYQKQKRSIQDTILLALNYPEIYDQITESTRMKNQPNRPKAILFEGPPGTGKTTSAKIISQQVNIPLIYLPIQSIMSQFYGKSEQKLSEMWETCKKIGRVIIFIDQIDALAGKRSSDMHEASRRVLSTLLRKIDSFQSNTNVMLICATNRKEDLDPAMLSRIDLSISFDLPDHHSRAAIFKRYAKHLSEQERNMLAQQSEGFSGRNISDVCKHAQRKWASKLIRQQTKQKLPNLSQYIISLHERKAARLNQN